MSTGFPDFQRGQAQVSDQILSATYTVPATGGTVLSAAQYMSSWRCLSVSFTPTAAGYIQVLVLWLSSTTPQATVATSQLVIYGTGQQSFVLPAVTSWFQLQFATASTGAAVNVATYAQGTNAPALPAPARWSQAPLLWVDQSVAAGSFAEVGPSATAGGPAVWSVWAYSGNAYGALLKYWDWSTGATKIIGRVYGAASAGGPQFLPVSLPAAPAFVELDNNSTVAQQMTSSLVVA